MLVYRCTVHTRQPITIYNFKVKVRSVYVTAENKTNNTAHTEGLIVKPGDSIYSIVINMSKSVLAYVVVFCHQRRQQTAGRGHDQSESD